MTLKRGVSLTMNFRANIEQKASKTLLGFGDDRIGVTNRKLIKNGKGWIPIMGEMHYSRIPREKWEETLQKMKESGINVVASYVFWIHHEETKGKYDFSGNRDIAHFIRLCHKLGMEFCLRIGPWAHGECRNGGFPDWLCEECQDTLRSERDPYFSYVRQYINAVAEQVKGLSLFGIQVENEKTNDPDYIEKIRQIVLEAGLSTPLYTATGWGRAMLPDTVLPMFGGYPEAPWAEHTQELEPNANYFFSHIREDGCIGADMLGTVTGDGSKEPTTPFMTCELGGGNQVSYHRRPLITSRDIEALTICKLGSGANLIGYYMYVGGLNPIGNTTMQESKATGYPNDYPVISYDFQSPIGDMGQLRESWYRLSYIHQFVDSFGEILADMSAIMPDEAPASMDDIETLRCALRSDGNSGFLFINNHIRLHKLPAHPKHIFNIDFKESQVSFELDIPSDSSFFIPVNISIAGLNITFASAQPVSATESQLKLIQIPGIIPTVTLNDGRIITLEAGVNHIDRTEVILLPYKEYVPSALSEVGVEPIESNCDIDILLSHLPLENFTADYSVNWTPEDKWLVIKAKGNIAGFYINNRLISDFYLYGDSWVIDLRAVPYNQGIIKIQPFSKEDEGSVYMEVPFETGVHIPQVYTCREDRLFI